MGHLGVQSAFASEAFQALGYRRIVSSLRLSSMHVLGFWFGIDDIHTSFTVSEKAAIKQQPLSSDE